MSQDNVEIVRRHMAAFASGDYEGALAAYRSQALEAAGLSGSSGYRSDERGPPM